MGMSRFLLTIVYVAVIAIFGFDLWRGFRTGQMRFRAGVGLKAAARREADPRGFWIYALFNLLGIAIAASGLCQTGLQNA